MRNIQEITKKLKQKLPPEFLESKPVGRGKNQQFINYLPWFNVCEILDDVCQGEWEWHIKDFKKIGDRIVLIGSLTIYASDETTTMAYTREATGTELLKEQYFNQQSQKWELREIAYGDPGSNAEAMSLRRAAAKFALGRYLYHAGEATKNRSHSNGNKNGSSYQQRQPEKLPFHDKESAIKWGYQKLGGIGLKGLAEKIMEETAPDETGKKGRNFYYAILKEVEEMGEPEQS
jgi:hypothetical protein